MDWTSIINMVTIHVLSQLAELYLLNPCSALRFSELVWACIVAAPDTS